MRPFLIADLNRTISIPKRQPISINYSVNGTVFEKNLDARDHAIIKQISALGLPVGLPLDRMMHAPEDVPRWGDEWRAGVAAFSHIHHFFLPRPARALAFMWRKASLEAEAGLRGPLLFFIEQAILGMSLLNRYAPSHFSQVNRIMSGRIRAFSQHSECSPWYILDGKLSRLSAAFAKFTRKHANSMVSTGDCGAIEIGNNSVDYIFTDPPFGFNFAYAELNFLIEAWHRVFTRSSK